MNLSRAIDVGSNRQKIGKIDCADCTKYKLGLSDNLTVVSRVWKTYHHNEDV